jgi:RES domain-containing protein
MDLDHPPTVALESKVVFRYANYDTPLWVRPNTNAGRWQAAGDPPTQYFCLTPEGAWAELARAEELRTERDLGLARTVIWAIEVSQAMIVDYSTFDRAEAAGFPPEALIDDDWSRCQQEGKRLRDLGYLGVLAPAAALPATTNLTIFGAKVMSTWGVPSLLASSMPVCAVARGTAAFTDLTTKVRFYGDEHPAYKAFATARLRTKRRPPPP